MTNEFQNNVDALLVMLPAHIQRAVEERSNEYRTKSKSATFTYVDEVPVGTMEKPVLLKDGVTFSPKIEIFETVNYMKLLAIIVEELERWNIY